MSSFCIPASMGALIADAAQEAGVKLLETGGFVLGPTGTDRSTVLALSGERGVDRMSRLFRVSGLAIASLFDWADERDLRILAQWHSHRLEAFLSETDLKHGFNVPGFRTAVVPHYEEPSSNPADWGWWMYDEDSWVETPAPATTVDEFTVVTFEEGRVDGC
jgi:hypothetical protein